MKSDLKDNCDQRFQAEWKAIRKLHFEAKLENHFEDCEEIFQSSHCLIRLLKEFLDHLLVIASPAFVTAKELEAL